MRSAQRPQKLAINQGAAGSRNFIYLIIDRETKDAAVVDAAWDTVGVLRIAQALELNLVAALYTHAHVDHTGGSGMAEGLVLEGLANLALAGVPAFMGTDDVESAQNVCSLPSRESPLMVPQIVGLDDGDVLPIGELKVKAMHTPGHTAGSICYACGGDVEDDAEIEVLITGDCLFIEAWGNIARYDGATEQMFESLQRLSQLPEMVAVLPGHHYHDNDEMRMSRIGQERQTNPGFRVPDVESFITLSDPDAPLPEGVKEITQEDLAAMQEEQAKRDAAAKEIYEPQHRDGARDRPFGAEQGERVEDPALKEQLERGWEFLSAAAAEEGAVQTESGLVINESVVGEGAAPTSLDSVEVHYEGKLIDGTVFDSSIARGESITFPLGAVIAGWTEGLQLMKEGGKATLTIPMDLAYGTDGSPPTIPGGATLVFEVELISVQSAGGVSSSGASGSSAVPNLFQGFGGFRQQRRCERARLPWMSCAAV
eukprot:COSAG04_NODE_1187_length_7847_cov_3.494579_2_plen_484_part_00